MRKLYKIIGVFLLIIVICSPSPIIAKEYEFSGDTSDSDWETAWKDMKKQLPEELKEKIKSISDDNKKLEFLHLAYDSIQNKEALNELKVLIKGIELIQN